MNEYEKQLEAHIEVLQLQKSRVEFELEKASKECRESIQKAQDNSIAYIRFIMAVNSIIDMDDAMVYGGNVTLRLKGDQLVVAEEVYNKVFKPH